MTSIDAFLCEPTVVEASWLDLNNKTSHGNVKKILISCLSEKTKKYLHGLAVDIDTAE